MIIAGVRQAFPLEQTISQCRYVAFRKGIQGTLSMTNANPGTAVAAKIYRKRRVTMASGKSDKVKGRVKEAVGALTGDKKLKRKGLAAA